MAGETFKFKKVVKIENKEIRKQRGKLIRIGKISAKVVIFTKIAGNNKN